MGDDLPAKKGPPMPTLPNQIIAFLAAFAPLFTRPSFQKVRLLVAGAILAPGKRTVTACLRAIGLAEEVHFQNYHRLLNRARWSSRKAAGILLGLLVDTLAPEGELVMGIDETLERRKGDKIETKGLYHDGVRSSKSRRVQSTGLRWISLMLLVPIPWAGQRVWALPFFSVLAPSERYHLKQGRRHKHLADWARQMLKQTHRWLKERSIVLVADSGYAALDFLAACQALRPSVRVVTRLRLDAALYEPAPERKPGQKGRPRKRGQRLPTLAARLADASTNFRPLVITGWYRQTQRAIEVFSDTCVWYRGGEPVVPLRYVLIKDPQGQFAPQALLCTDLAATPEQIVAWFVQRWQLETTFQQVRAHLGVETQRQWNAMAIMRTTPALLGLFSLVSILAHQQAKQGCLWVRQAAWYKKSEATFSDAIACVRRQLWSEMLFCRFSAKTDREIIQQVLLERFADALCYAA